MKLTIWSESPRGKVCYRESEVEAAPTTMSDTRDTTSIGCDAILYDAARFEPQDYDLFKLSDGSRAVIVSLPEASAIFVDGKLPRDPVDLVQLIHRIATESAGVTAVESSGSLVLPQLYVKTSNSECSLVKNDDVDMYDISWSSGDITKFFPTGVILIDEYGLLAGRIEIDLGMHGVSSS